MISFLRIIVILFTCSICTALLADESICPGENNSRQDVLWCAGHEEFNSTACQANPLGSKCLEENGYDTHIPYSNFRVVGGSLGGAIASGAAVGNGYLSGRSSPGGTGPGYLIIPDQTPSMSAGLRFYVKFAEGYLHSNWDRGNHGPSLQSTEDPCSVRYSLDWYDNGASFIMQSACSDTVVVPTNIRQISLKNNRWYLIEMQATMNTQTSSADAFSGNGVLRAYVDGEKVLEHTNVNLRGSSGSLWKGGYAARSYYAVGTPAWSGSVMYDNFVYSNSDTYIGPAENENPKGEADPNSPYINFASYNGYVGSKMSGDCSSPSSSVRFTPLDGYWRNQAAITLQSRITNGFYRSYCGEGGGGRARVVLESIEDAGEIAQGSASRQLPLSIRGKILIPSDALFNTVEPIAGFMDSSSYWQQSTGPAKVLGFGISGNYWSLVTRDNSQYYFSKISDITIERERWLDFNFIISRDRKVSFAVGKQVVIADFQMGNSFSWLWNEVAGRVAQISVGSDFNASQRLEDKALEVKLIGGNSGAGISYDMSAADRTPHYVLHGWMYIPQTNDFSSLPALSGFARYGADRANGGDSNWAYYLAITVTPEKKWALVQRSTTSSFVAKESSMPVLTDQWNEFEIIASKSGTVSLMINREWVIEDYEPSSSIDWIWDDYSGGARNLVLGVLDYRGTAPFSLYIDDTDVLSASAWSCKGWSEQSCPFSSQ